MPVKNKNCNFTDPVNYKGETPTSTDEAFEFSTANCSTTVLEQKTNATTGAEFYLNKSVNYGDVIVIGFLIIFLVFGVTKFFINRIIPKMIDFKRH